MTAAPSAEPGRTDPGGDKPRPRAVVILAGVALVALLADLATKHLALATLTDREPVRLLGGLVYFSLTRNSGAAWSIGSDHTWVFPLITIGVVGWIVWMALRLRSLPWAISLGLVLGGALGNLVDRIFRAPSPFHGHVVDMISLFDPYGQVWPVFNLADSSLVCGVLLAVLLELTGRQRDGRRVGRDGDPAAATATQTADQRERA
ncbi:signal peptidase II [Micromonospora acroterricola]|uniref:Lipoprotein signal peptidase n=1 Tax=Micromonospora acroterricola TaxID=2202421 RepID=A0A317D5C7_9ACTN|nr:signal peptidase II [Micromonospora acroterricola]PWR08836.1 signal peptidase II [Micromonospora acroterricola]